MAKPKILVTNDDGIFAPGIKALYDAMQEIGDPYVVAPDSEQSAVGHAITIADPLRVQEVERDGRFFGWAVNGTPADCVKLASKALLDFQPDLVVSGINRGSNAATNIIYSGTVSAATEGTMIGLPSIAFSMATFRPVDLRPAQKIARQIASQVLRNGLPDDTLLNVNFPPVAAEEIRGIRITRQGLGRFVDQFEKRVDPMGRTYYWVTGNFHKMDSDPDIDEVAIRENYVSVTPIKYELTDHQLLKSLEGWQFDDDPS